jgi:hypothetical protein
MAYDEEGNIISDTKFSPPKVAKVQSNGRQKQLQNQNTSNKQPRISSFSFGGPGPTTRTSASFKSPSTSSTRVTAKQPSIQERFDAKAKAGAYDTSGITIGNFANVGSDALEGDSRGRSHASMSPQERANAIAAEQARALAQKQQDIITAGELQNDTASDIANSLLQHTGVMPNLDRLDDMIGFIAGASGNLREGYSVFSDDPMMRNPTNRKEALHALQEASTHEASGVGIITLTDEALRGLNNAYRNSDNEEMKDYVGSLVAGSEIFVDNGVLLNPSNENDKLLMDQRSWLNEAIGVASDLAHESYELENFGKEKLMEFGFQEATNTSTRLYNAEKDRLTKEHELKMARIEAQIEAKGRERVVQLTGLENRQTAQLEHDQALEQLEAKQADDIAILEAQLFNDQERIRSQTNAQQGLMTVQFEFDTQITQLEQAFMREQAALQHAISLGELQEASRHSRAIELLTAQKNEVQSEQNKMAFLTSMAETPAMLYMLREQGVLSQFTGGFFGGHDVGGMLEDIINAIPEKSRPNIQQFNAMATLSQEMETYTAGATRGYTPDEFKGYVTGTSPYTPGGAQIRTGAPSDYAGPPGSEVAPTYDFEGTQVEDYGAIPTQQIQPFDMGSALDKISDAYGPTVPDLMPRGLDPVSGRDLGVEEDPGSFRFESLRDTAKVTREDRELSETGGIVRGIADERVLRELNTVERRDFVAGSMGVKDEPYERTFRSRWRQPGTSPIPQVHKDISDYLTQVWGVRSAAKAMADTIMGDANALLAQGASGLEVAKYAEERITKMIQEDGVYQASSGNTWIHGKEYKMQPKQAMIAFKRQLSRGELIPARVGELELGKVE